MEKTILLAFWILPRGDFQQPVRINRCMIAISGAASVAFGIFLVYQIGLFTLVVWIQKDLAATELTTRASSNS
jgi:hypothetical protein